MVFVPAIEPPTLRDGDLTLRPPLPGDAEAVTAACQDAAIHRWVRVPSPYRREHAESWLARCEAQARVKTCDVAPQDGFKPCFGRKTIERVTMIYGFCVSVLC